MSDFAETVRKAMRALAPQPASLDDLLENGRVLRLRTGYNVRELGGYATPAGPTLRHRFLRAGSTKSLTESDLGLLHQWGVTRIADLRSVGESPRLSCRFARQEWATWENVPLYDYDLSAPAMVPVRNAGGYFVEGYLHMLASRQAIRRLFWFFAQARSDECVLFHCAAGMDRTGVVAMLLLGLADVPRRQIVADYAYSFGDVEEVEEALDAAGDAVESAFITTHLRNRIAIIGTVLDTVVHEHGSVRAYLASCGIPDEELDAVRDHLLR